MHLQPKPVDFSAGDFTEEDVFGQIHALIVKRYLGKLQRINFLASKFFNVS